MKEDTQVHQILKLTHIDSTMDHLKKTIKNLAKQRQKIVDNLSAIPGANLSNYVNAALNFPSEEEKCSKHTDLENKINQLTEMVRDISERRDGPPQSANSLGERMDNSV
jgi:ABC-type transporter Mla subunit MlaD